jgi:hypothetical protein
MKQDEMEVLYHAAMRGRNAMSNELLTVTKERDALSALLEKTVPALIRLGDFVGNIDEGGASGAGRIDRCDLILKVRNAIARATGQPVPEEDEGPEPPYAGYESEAQLRRMAEVRRLEALRREGLIP